MAFDVSDGDKFTARLIHHGPGYESYEGDLAFDVINADGTTVATVDDTNPGAGVDDASNYNESITIDPDNEGYSSGTERWYLKVYAPDSPVDEDCPNGGSSPCDGEFEIQFSNQPDASISENDGDDTLVEGTDSITFDASGSSDPDGDISEYRWDFDGDGSTDKTTSSDTTTHTYTIDDATYEGSSATFTPEVTVADSAGGTDTATLGNSLTIHNDFDEDDTADINDGDGDDDGITDSNDPADYNVYPSASDSSSESTKEDSTLTVNDGDSADLTELATDGGKSYDPNTDPISVEQIDGESFSAGSTVTLDSGATVTVESDGSWTYDPNGAYDSLGQGETGTDEFNYTVSDNPHSGTAAATDRGTVSITIDGINRAPTAPTDDSIGTNEVAEDAGSGASVGVTANSTDADGDVITWSLTDNASGRFQIDQSGVVTTDDASKIDYEGANNNDYTITAKASDGSASSTSDFTISVTDVGEIPSLTSGTSDSVAEDATDGTNVHDAEANVNGSADEGVNYTITSGNSDGAYAIDSSTGQITVNDTGKLDHETSTSRAVTVEASESGLGTTQDVTIRVTDADETPTFTSSGSASVSEDALNDGSLQDIEANVGGDADEDVSYAITGGNGSAAFTIDSSTGAVSVEDTTELDHENASTVTLTVEASEGNAAQTQTLTIDVTDADETPTFLSSNAASLTESAANTTDVADVNATVDQTRSGNADVGVEYAVVGGNGSAGFTIDNTGQLTVDDTNQIDYETASTLTVTVEASDGANSQTQTLTVDVTDADESPGFTSSGSTSVVEDDTDGTTVHDVDADVGGDADEDVSYAITGGNGSAAFTIDSSTGAVSVEDTTQLDHENASTVTLTVEASEATATRTQILTVSVDSAEPTFTQATPPAGLTVTTTEDQTATLSGHLEVEDLSSTDTLSFSVAAGPANGTVTGVDGQSVAVTSGGTHTLSSSAYEPDSDFVGTDSFDVTVEDDDGHTETVTVTVTVSPVNDPPEVTLGADRNVNQNTSQQTVSGFAGFHMGGGSDEAVQGLADVTVTSDTPVLFDTAPEIDTNGTLTYTPASGVSGTATVTVQAQDDNGTSAGGDDTSTNRTFTITIDNRDPGGGGSSGGALFGDETENEQGDETEDEQGDETEDEQGDETEGESQGSDGGASDSSDGGDGSVAAGGDGDAGDENVVRTDPDQLPDLEIVDIELETEPANSVDARSIITIENVADVAQETDVQFKLNGAVVAEKTVQVPADERITVTHTERVEDEGMHTVEASVGTTTETGTVVRTTDFEVGTVELNENGNEVGAPGDESGVAEGLPVLLIAVGLVASVGVAVLAWRRRE